MRKTVNIDGKDIALKANGLTLIRYKDWFGRDLISDFKAVQTAFEADGAITGEIFEIVSKLTYTMAKQADKSVSDNFDDWMDQFEHFPISEFAADVIMFWASSITASSEVQSKNV